MANIKIEIHNRSIAPRKEILISWKISQDEKKQQNYMKIGDVH